MELKDIIEEIKERKLTAYEIAKNTSLTEVGINKILNGKSIRPHKSTLDILRAYLKNTCNTDITNKSENLTTLQLLDMVITRLEKIKDNPIIKKLDKTESSQQELENKVNSESSSKNI